MNPEQFHLAFYRFVHIADAPRVAALLRSWGTGLSGSVQVAIEGISGTLAGSDSALDAFTRRLTGAAELRGLFVGMRFRRSACRTPPYTRLKVQARAEILPLGVGRVDAVGRPGLQLDAAAWHDLLADPAALVIDNRNAFEYRLGHFRGAVDPGVDNFRDLPRYVSEHAATWKSEGRKVAMYCTGGIRCEKTAAWLADTQGLQVLQLEGGILGYLASATPRQREAWQGECFVFDNRIALDASLQETATCAAEVYAGDPREAWRLQRALRLDDALAR